MKTEYVMFFFSRIRLALLLIVLVPVAVQAATDKGPVFYGSDTTGTGSSFYAGLIRGGSQTSLDAFWVTSRSLGSCDLRVLLTNSPGAGKSWDITILYNNAAPAAGSDCGDDIASMSTATGTCTISGTNNSCAQAITFAAAPAANSCLQLVGTANNTPAVSGQVIWMLQCAEAGAVDGISNWTSVQSTSFVNPFVAGPAASGSHTGNAGRSWIVPYNITACAGLMQIETVGGGTSTRTLAYRQSTTSLSAGAGAAGCTTLAYSSSATLATFGAADKNASWTIDNTLSASQFDCMVIDVQQTNTPAGTGGESWAVACSADSSETYTTGGRVFTESDQNSQTSSFNIADRLQTTLTANAGFWLAGDTQLDRCDLATSFTNLGAGTDTPTWDVDLRYSTAGLGAGQVCNDLTYTTLDLCTLTVGTHRSCTATAQDVTIPAGGCFQLRATAGGTITTGTGGQTWMAHCYPVSGAARRLFAPILME